MDSKGRTRGGSARFGVPWPRLGRPALDPVRTGRQDAGWTAPGFGGLRTAGSAVMVVVVALLAFATGTVRRPEGELWALAYDLGLYNVIFVAAAVACRQAARRVPAERLAWSALGVALLLNVAANSIYSLVIVRMAEEPYPSVSDALWLAYYPLQYVALVAIVRARVPRFHPSMWLDGLVGALGVAAVSVAVLLGPSLRIGPGSPPRS